MSRGRPRTITSPMENYIGAILKKDPERTIKKLHSGLRNALQKAITKQLTESHPELSRDEIIKEVDKQVDKQLPSESAIDKWVRNKGIRKEFLSRPKNPEEEDKKWSIGTCKKYDIPFDMVPLLIECDRAYLKQREIGEQSAQKKDENDGGAPLVLYVEEALGQISIRIAKWMSRLRPMVNILIEKYKNNKIGEDEEILMSKDRLVPNTASPLTLVTGTSIEGWTINPVDIWANQSFTLTTGYRLFALKWLLYDVARLYDFGEDISESLGRKYYDTSEIDEMLFVKEYPRYRDFVQAMIEVTEYITFAEQTWQLKKDGETNGKR